MSDIFFKHGYSDLHFDRSQFNFSKKDWIVEFQKSKFEILLRRNDKRDIWEPVVDPDGISIYLIGRITLNEKSWNLATQLSGNGGLACKYIFYLLKEYGLDALPNYLNGAFAVFISNFKGENYVITDRMGFTPIYYKCQKDCITLSSYLDALDSKYDENLDLVSLGEYLNYGRVEHPNTYYKKVKQLDPGSIYKISDQSISKIKTYYTFKFKWRGEKPKQLIEELKDAINISVYERTLPILGKSGIFLSGGMDSRGILASARQPSEIVTSTFYDEINAEYETAHEIAKRYKSTHIGLQRTKEHYIKNSPDSVNLMSGQWSVLEGHYTGFIDKILDLDVDNWLTGCFADWMFKGLASNTRYLKIFGKNIPTIKRLDKFNSVYYKPKFDMTNPELNIEIEKRKHTVLKDIYNYKAEEFDWNIERTRLFPMNREPDMGSRHILARVLRWDPVLADNRLIELFERIPVSQKLENYIWGNAIAKICRGNNDIKDNNWGARVDANNYQRIFSFLKENIRRKLSNKNSKSVGNVSTTGSWPNYYRVTLESEVLPIIWKSLNKDSFDTIEKITGMNYQKMSYLDIAKQNLEYFYRILTILIWLDRKI